MSNLSARVRLVENSNPSSEDILSDATETLYPDRYRNIHGDPGSEIIYASQFFDDIQLKTAASNDGDDYFLFAHYLWNASLQLTELISDSSQSLDNATSEYGYRLSWSVKGEIVLELGAGRSVISLVPHLFISTHARARYGTCRHHECIGWSTTCHYI